ncbi:TOMM precursor leader peptide-binding protein [Actinoallomurus rhizosphaericola]|uniref:TOMM precursor leader peptide-binding protein n=1 Tax=Actinoallomurus rhizosphaericola TaxID=2952536 RepID=UPI0020916461|nr:TOMM precursor leader peptide-binding protein [Actinoallomurus rhizosphaericola]MCO5991791.1 TOMM precursor leader peptide-binding protein [Actinoallomurus rhizosphaericola]
MDDDTATDVRITADGDFGAAFAEHLRGLLASAGGPVRAGTPRIDVRASWRDVPSEFAAFGAAERPAPWLPVAVAHPYIRVGPLFVSGRAPCHTCFRARTRQHEDPVEEEIRQRLAADPGLGVRGFLPHQSMIAAGLALALLQGEERGTVAVIDCRTDEVATWRVTPAEQCPGCDDGTDR